MHCQFKPLRVWVKRTKENKEVYMHTQLDRGYNTKWLQNAWCDDTENSKGVTGQAILRKTPVIQYL